MLGFKKALSVHMTASDTQMQNCVELVTVTQYKEKTKSSNQLKQASKSGVGEVMDIGIGVGELLKENPA